MIERLATWFWRRHTHLRSHCRYTGCDQLVVEGQRHCSSQCAALEQADLIS